MRHPTLGLDNFARRQLLLAKLDRTEPKGGAAKIIYDCLRRALHA